MKARYRTFVLGLLVLLSCDSPLKDNGQPMRPLGEKVWLEIGFVRPTQTPSLEIETEYEYGCYNYAIQYNAYGSDELFGFVLKGATLGQICATAIGPARLSYPLYIENGTYTIQIMMNNAVGTHTLVVTDSALYLYGKSEISEPKDSVFWRSDELEVHNTLR